MSLEIIASLIRERARWKEIDADHGVRRFAYGDLVARLTQHECGRHWQLQKEDGGRPARSIADVPSLVEALMDLEEWHDNPGQEWLSL